MRKKISNSSASTLSRSELMRKVRQKGTEAEQKVCKFLQERGYRFSKNTEDLPGRPDVANRSQKWAIFVNGCFWHRHPGCVRSSSPKTNSAFWNSKFEDNISRDIRKKRELELLGFRVHIVWECETFKEQRLEDVFAAFFGKSMETLNLVAEKPLDSYGRSDSATSKQNRFIYSIDKKLQIIRTINNGLQNSIARPKLQLDSLQKQSDISAAYDQILQRRAEKPRADYGNRLNVVDIFCGCGGLSLGVLLACEALERTFCATAALDHDQDSLRVYRSNFNPQFDLDTDIRKIFSNDAARTTASKGHALNKIAKDGVDILLAGPPCQGFSDLNNHTRRDDDRNDLYYYVAKVASILKPKSIIIENVPNVVYGKNKVIDKTIDVLLREGYSVDTKVIDFSVIGVPQRRKRHVVLATEKAAPSLAEIVESHKVHSPRTLQWAINDLSNHRNERSLEANNIIDKATVLSPENRKRIEYLFNKDLYNLPNKLRPKCHQNDDHSYTSMYGRLKWDEPAQTITSGFRSPGQGRYIHPKEKRTITAHEAARIQGFPDFFSFSDVKTLSSLSKMIGNAVPMNLSFVITVELILAGLV